MGTFQSFRKAYGALKDSTMVGLAKVNNEYKDLDIAIVKATNHVELPPKERHLRKIFSATSVIRPRADVAYCIHALSKRLSKTRSWIVALKTLIVIHRTLREGDPTFREELLNYSHRGHVLQMPNFKDSSSPLAWDCSAWVRAYALFLEERLECFRTLRYDIESECPTKSSPGSNKANTRTRVLNGEQLLRQLPALQQLLYRLTGCLPEGAAYRNHLIQYTLALVLKESFKIYCAINDGIINLVDVFFDMPKRDAAMALQIYKRAGQQATNLANLYDYCRGLEITRNFQFPVLRQPPASFLHTMEEFIKEAHQAGSVNTRLEYQKLQHLSDKEHVNYQESEKAVGEKRKEMVNSKAKVEDPPLIPIEEDSVHKSVVTTEPNPKNLEESNALALAIVPNGLGNDVSKDQSPPFGDLSGLDSSGWELALITTPSTTSNSDRIPEPKMGGGFDKLLLDSLYDDDLARKNIQLQNAGYGFGQACAMSAPKPVEQQLKQQAFDPFVMSNSFAPPTGVRMANSQQQMMMQQQNGTYYQQQQQNMVPYQSTQQQSIIPYQPPQQQSMVPYQRPQQQVQPVVFNLAQQGNHVGGSAHVSGFSQPGMNMTQQGNHVGVSGFSQPGMNMTQQHWNRGGGGNVSGFSQPGMNMAQQQWNHGGLI